MILSLLVICAVIRSDAQSTPSPVEATVNSDGSSTFMRSMRRMNGGGSGGSTQSSEILILSIRDDELQMELDGCDGPEENRTCAYMVGSDTDHLIARDPHRCGPRNPGVHRVRLCEDNVVSKQWCHHPGVWGRTFNATGGLYYGGGYLTVPDGANCTRISNRGPLNTRRDCSFCTICPTGASAIDAVTPIACGGTAAFYANSTLNPGYTLGAQFDGANQFSSYWVQQDPDNRAIVVSFGTNRDLYATYTNNWPGQDRIMRIIHTDQCSAANSLIGLQTAATAAESAVRNGRNVLLITVNSENVLHRNHQNTGIFRQQYARFVLGIAGAYTYGSGTRYITAIQINGGTGPFYSRYENSLVYQQSGVVGIYGKGIDDQYVNVSITHDVERNDYLGEIMLCGNHDDIFAGTLTRVRTTSIHQHPEVFQNPGREAYMAASDAFCLTGNQTVEQSIAEARRLMNMDVLLRNDC